MRISGGELRGRRLVSFSGRAIRPTPEHIREALFNIIGQDLRGMRVLDLFAGTGVLGLEAISRGARSALLVDSAPQSLTIMQRNIELLKVHDRVRILRTDLRRSLQPVLDLQPESDLVFLDPPYGKDLAESVLKKLDVFSGLAEDALVVAEHFAKELGDPELATLSLESRRLYGQTAISIFTTRKRNC